MSMSGVGSSAPFLKTLTSPSFSAIKSRPSGRATKAVGLFNPDARVSCEKPLGRVVAARAGAQAHRSEGRDLVVHPVGLAHGTAAPGRLRGRFGGREPRLVVAPGG